MKNIALVCALPVLSNSGMLTVDLAFETVRAQLPDCNIVRFCASQYINRDGVMPIVYNPLTNVEQLEPFDLIIYWGDFMQWIKYGATYVGDQGLQELVAQQGISLAEAKSQVLDNWYSTYLLEGRKDLQKKAIVYGSTLCGIDSAQLANARYKSALTKLYKNAKLVLVRDMVTSHVVSQLIKSNHYFYGGDCALLLDPVTIESNLELTENNYFVYSFGRSNLGTELEDLCMEISKKSGIKAVKVPWLDPRLSVDSLMQSLSVIRNAKFAVTDIYHFSVNSWREKVPTLTFGRAASYANQGTLPDKKKEIFNTQIFAMNYYQYLEDFEKKFINNAAKEEYAVSCIKKATLQDPSNIFNAIAYQKATSLKTLIGCIKK
jgi:hypothetical protein